MSTFFLDKIKIRLYYGHRPAGVNYTHTPPPTLRVRFALPLGYVLLPQRRTFFIRPDYLQKTKLMAVLLVTTGVPPVAHARPHVRNIFLFV